MTDKVKLRLLYSTAKKIDALRKAFISLEDHGIVTKMAFDYPALSEDANIIERVYKDIQRNDRTVVVVSGGEYAKKAVRNYKARVSRYAKNQGISFEAAEFILTEIAEDNAQE